MSNNNYDSGDFRFTPPIIPNTKLAGQRNVLTYQNAPRTTETAQTNGGPTDNEYNNLSYRRSLNGFTSGPYSADKINPLGFPITQRADENPYFLFMGKFSSNSQGIQNTDPVQVGHVDISGITLNQQPSNIYNIPDTPKPYTLIQSNNVGGFYPNDYYKEGSKNSNLKIVYDASSCPVNWRIFGPIQNQVLDWEENGGPGPIGEQGPTGEQGPPGNTSLKTGLYDISNNGSFIFVPNPSKRDISGIYFDTNSFDISFNPTINPSAYVSVKGVTGSGTGTDLSFNKYFFKQPEMPMDCSCVLITSPLKIQITFDKPFNRSSGTTNRKEGKRYFYKNQQNNGFVENWLPEFTELVLDISGGPNSRKFCKDICGNFVHTGGVGQNSQAFALLSANNTVIDLIGTNNPNQQGITDQWNGGGNQYSGPNGLKTTIINGFTPSNNSGSYAGGSGGQNLIQTANTYDIAIYYRNNSLINTIVPQNDLYYNNHNVCLFKNVVLGQPGILPIPSSLRFWTNSGRTYFGGIGPSNKDVSLGILWSNTSITKVGYDCSFSFISNSGNTSGQQRVQVNGINKLDLSYNNLDISYNINTTSQSPFQPLNMTGIPDTRQYWPHPSTNVNDGIPTGSYDYIKVIDELTGVQSGKQHPEYKYIGTNYSGVNDTSPIQYVNGTDATKVIPILSRANCNLTGSIDYNNVMAVANTGWCNVDISNNGSVSSSNISSTNCRERQTLTDRSVYFVPTGENLYINTGNDIFKQLANHGEQKNDPTDQTYSELVTSDSLIGTKGLNVKLGEVKLEISNADNNFTTGTIDSYVHGWDNNENLTWANNPTSGAQEVDTTYKLKFDKSASFDVAKADLLTNYSDKRGYYLGFDISNVSVELDLNGNTYKDVAEYGYNPYILTLNHIVYKDGAPAPPTSTTTKEFEFYTGIEPSNPITISNISETTNQNSSALQYWFGIKRLPAPSSNNSINGDLELILQFYLNDVNPHWIPPVSQFNGTLVKAEFVYDPDSTSVAISLNSNNSNDVKWSDLCVSSNQAQTIFFTGQTGNPTAPSPSPFYVELHEGKVELVGSSQNGDGKYSRSVTDATPSRPLFGIKNNTITFSNNVTLPSPLTDSTVNNSNFKFNGQELFFDYTWPVTTNDLPVSIGSNINSQITLLQLPNTITSTPWGGTNINLPELGGITDNTPYNTSYDHTQLLSDNQAMWCNGFFVGSNLASGVDNPYINYGSTYFGQTNDYTNQRITGDDVTGVQVSSSNSQVQGGFSSSNFTNVKWILLKQNSVANSNVTVNVKKTGNTDAELGTDYLLFYCEYRNSLSYGSGNSTTDKYSTWLNAISGSIPAPNAIDKIGNNSTGGNNGCFAGGNLKNPQIKDLGTGTQQNKSKYFLFGLKPGTKISSLSIS